MIRKQTILMFLVILAMAFLTIPVDGAAGDCPNYCSNGLAYSRGSWDANNSVCVYAYRTACEGGCDARGTYCVSSQETTTETGSRSCQDYCAGGVVYSRGSYNSRTGSCDYSYRAACDAGCDARGTGCAAAQAATTAISSRSCPDYCSGGIHYFNGAWNDVTGQCDYMRRECVNGCDSSATTCARNPAGCPDYCHNGAHYYNGTWNEWAQQCDYSFREECISGCDSRGVACGQAATTQTISETGRFITCPADSSCISRQGAVDRWGSGIRMFSDSPCGRSSDGTDLYCIQPAGLATTEQAATGTERFATCPADCSCISRQGAVDRWQGAVQMCSYSPCGRASDGATLYCIRPTNQWTEQIRQRYEGTSDSVTGVSPSEESGQMLFVVTRERQAMLFGIVPVRMTVRERLNATDLVFLGDERPWWAFLTTDTTSRASEGP